MLSVYTLYGMEEQPIELPNATDIDTKSELPIVNIVSEVPFPSYSTIPITYEPKVKCSQIISSTKKLPEPKQKNRETPEVHYDTQRWWISRLVGYCSDNTNKALSICNSLKNKEAKSIGNITQVAHDLEWGINDIIAKATDERKKLPKTNISIDQLQQAIRNNYMYIDHLSTIIETCDQKDIQLQEGILTNAYKCIKTEDAANLQYAYLIMQETQKRLQKDKHLRNIIHKVKLKKNDVDPISDDEYDDTSMAHHVLTYKESK
jgi:hypothetical protein